MKKMSSLIIGIIWIGLAIALAIFFCKMYKQNDFIGFINMKNINFEEKVIENFFDSNSVKEIKTELSSETISVKVEDREDFKVEVFSSLSDNSVKLPEVYCSDNVLCIKRTATMQFNFGFIFNSNRTKVVITIPKKAMENLILNLHSASSNIELEDCKVKNIFVKNSSGSISVDNCSANNITVQNTSGGIKVKDAKASELYIANTSGIIRLEQADADKVQIANTSGSIKLQKVNAKDVSVANTSGSISVEQSSVEFVNAASTSGSVRLDGSFSGANVGVTSGSIKVENNIPLTKTTYFKAKSGSVRLALTENDGFTLNFRCSSGSVRNEFTGFSGKKSGKDVYKNGATELNVESTSGSITISRN